MGPSELGSEAGGSGRSSRSTGRTTNDNSSLLLSCRGVTKWYGAVHAINGVDLDFRAGEVHALLGENGAGKSTFIKVLAGAVPADRGEIRVAGEPVAIKDAASSRRLGIGVAFQELSLAPDLSVSE